MSLFPHAHWQTSSENHDEIVNNFQRHVSLTMSSDLEEKCSHETKCCINNQEKVSAEIKNLVRSTIASIDESGTMSSRVEVILSEFTAVKETSTLNERQINEVRAQLEQKIKERKNNLISKQQKKRSKASTPKKKVCAP